MRSGPEHAVGVGGPVVDLGGGHQLAALREPGDQHGLQVGARGVDCRGVAGGAGAEDQQAGVLGGHGRLRGRANAAEFRGSGGGRRRAQASPDRAAARSRDARSRRYNATDEVDRAKPVFFNKNDKPTTRAPARRAEPADVDAVAALRAPGPRGVLAARRGRVPVPRADPRARYKRSRSRLVVLRQRRGRRQPRRLRRRVAVRPPAVPVRRVGVVVGRGAASCSSSPATGTSSHPESRREHPLPLRIVGFALVLAVERVARGDPPVEAARRRCRSRRAARSATRSATRCRARSASTARRCCCSRCSPRASSLFFGISWLRVMERIGALRRRAASRALRRWREDRVDRRIGEEHAAEREQVVEHLREETHRARADPRRAAAGADRALGARRQGEAAAALHRHARFAAAAAVAARGRAAGAPRRSARRRSSSPRA